MAKVIIKSERITPFGGIFPVREQFSRFVGPVIDKVLGLRCTSYGYQYSEIVGSLSSVYFCGGSGLVVEAAVEIVMGQVVGRDVGLCRGRQCCSAEQEHGVSFHEG